MSKPALSVIFVGQGYLARVDVPSGADEPSRRVWRAARPASVSSIAGAIESDPAVIADLGGDCWVLAEDLWTQMLALPAAAVAGLDARAVERALAYELESLSGLSPAESMLGFVPGDDSPAGERTFWVTQAPADEIARIAQIIRCAGGQLVGLAHPAGLTAEPPPSQAGSSPPGDWLIRCAADLTGGLAPAVPIIRPAARPPSVRRLVAASIALTIASAAACGLLAAWLHHSATAAATRVTIEQAGPRRQIAEFDARIVRIKADLADLASRRPATRPDIAAELSVYRGRAPALLDALAALAAPDRIVTSIRADRGGAATVEGICLSSASADELAAGLCARLTPVGWSVGGARKTARRQAPDGGPWQFEVAVEPIRRRPPSANPTVPAIGRPQPGGRGGSP